MFNSTSNGRIDDQPTRRGLTNRVDRRGKVELVFAFFKESFWKLTGKSKEKLSVLCNFDLFLRY